MPHLPDLADRSSTADIQPHDANFGAHGHQFTQARLIYIGSHNAVAYVHTPCSLPNSNPIPLIGGRAHALLPTLPQSPTLQDIEQRRRLCGSPTRPLPSCGGRLDCHLRQSKTIVRARTHHANMIFWAVDWRVFSFHPCFFYFSGCGDCAFFCLSCSAPSH